MRLGFTGSNNLDPTDSRSPRVGVTQRRMLTALERYKNHRSPTTLELAQHLGLTRDQAHNALNRLRRRDLVVSDQVVAVIKGQRRQVKQWRLR